VSKLEAALQEHLGQIAQAQLVSQPPQDDQHHNIGRELQMVELSGSALVKSAGAVGAFESGVTKRGLAGQLGSCE
jgi:hypothetical protein